MLHDTFKNKGILSEIFFELEVFTFIAAIQFVKNLPYGRTTDRANPDLVLIELKGSCSTKHALLKKLALEQGISTVSLYLCLFKMNGNNTPKLEEVLQKHDISYIVEAHCILSVNGEFIDVTSETSDYDSLKNDILELVEIQPEQIGDFKVDYHQTYLKKWLKKRNSEYSFEEFWSIREQCIKVLSS